jgi:hypothetical protein
MTTRSGCEVEKRTERECGGAAAMWWSGWGGVVERRLARKGEGRGGGARSREVGREPQGKRVARVETP